MFLEAVGTVLAVIMPALLKSIGRAIRGDKDAHRRLSAIMPAESRSSLERAIDEAVLLEDYGSER